MKSDEGIFKMLSKSSIIRNQYENVIPITLRNLKKAAIWQPFFLNKINKPEILKLSRLLKF